MLQEIIVLTVAYIVLIGLFQPNKTKTATPQTITPQTATPQTITPQTITPQTATPQTITPQTITPQTITPQTITPQTEKDLGKMTIRQLKSLAKSVKLKNYGSMRKSELVLALS